MEEEEEEEEAGCLTSTASARLALICGLCGEVYSGKEVP